MMMWNFANVLKEFDAACEWWVAVNFQRIIGIFSLTKSGSGFPFPWFEKMLQVVRYRTGSFFYLCAIPFSPPFQSNTTFLSKRKRMREEKHHHWNEERQKFIVCINFSQWSTKLRIKSNFVFNSRQSCLFCIVSLLCFVLFSIFFCCSFFFSVDSSNFSWNIFLIVFSLFSVSPLLQPFLFAIPYYVTYELHNRNIFPIVKCLYAGLLGCREMKVEHQSVRIVSCRMTAAQHTHID